MRVLAIALLVAGSALASPITVTGSGTFSTSSTGSGWDLFFNGSDGTNAVSGGFSGASGSPMDGFLGGTNGSAFAGSLINGIQFGPGYASFSLGGGSGNITGYDSQQHVVVTQDIVGFLLVTSEQCSGSDCRGTFTVTTPEPGTAVALLLGLAMLAALACSRDRRRAS
ncbi:MAG TPA: PEP-CTERM sorting domain-containing protein [Bryobacteraceae bacterium]